MTDEQNPAPSPDPLEEEIGELLAEAEALTSELSDEIGEESAGDFSDPDYFGDEGGVEFTTEVRMQEAEHALSEATEELGGEKKTTPGKGLKLPSSNSVSLPKKSDSAKPKSENSISLPAAGSTTKTESLVAAKTSEPAIEAQESAKSHRAAELNRRIAVIGERLEPVGRIVCTVLETIDRPFSRIQLRIRTVLGWLALAFFVAAISLWLFAV
ncbi:MAG: hypothetical protein DHS20C16_16190 [Phycisphaerae bacterium]|nr:MAG: hypothetical protein DHS20C16_16190 [Phycisphaerae bacterium]